VLVLKDIACGVWYKLCINTQQFLIGFNQLAKHVKNIQWWRVKYFDNGIWKQKCCGVDLKLITQIVAGISV